MNAPINQNRTVTAVEGRRAIHRCFKSKRPVFLWGPMGIGKSELIAGIAAEMGGLTIDLRMATMEPTDLRGIPYFNKDTGTMCWAPPVELPSKELAAQYPIVVLFLDEMNSAAPAVQAAAYQLVLNRRVGTYILPDNVVIVAAGNREGDRGVTYRMPAPLANRFLHLEVKVDFDSWNQWAVVNQVHPDVVGYLNFAKGDLYDFRPESASRAFATPRSWSFVADVLRDENHSDGTTMDLISGAVGEGLAVKFMAHRKFTGLLPIPTDVLEGKVKELRTKEVSAQYALMINICYELKDYFTKQKASGKLDDKKWHEMIDNFFRFMMENFNTEVCILAVKTALQTYGLVFQGSKMKTYAEFAKKYGQYITAAMSAK